MRYFLLSLILIFSIITSASADQQVYIQVRFQEETDYGSYHDALYFTQAEYDALKQEDIDTLKQKRIDNWVYIITHPPEYVEPTLKELKEKSIEEKDVLLKRDKEYKSVLNEWDTFSELNNNIVEYAALRKKIIDARPGAKGASRC